MTNKCTKCNICNRKIRGADISGRVRSMNMQRRTAHVSMSRLAEIPNSLFQSPTSLSAQYCPRGHAAPQHNNVTNNEHNFHCIACRRRSGGCPKRSEVTCPSALTPISSRWTMVTILPCQAWHGRGQGGLSRQLQSPTSRCPKQPYTEGFYKYDMHNIIAKISQSAPPMHFFRD
jgi:hypothetical protein